MSEETIVTTNEVEQAEPIMNKAICMIINHGYLGTSKTLKGSVKQKALDSIEVKDSAMVGMNKELYNCKELNDIFNAMEKMDAYITIFASPYSLFRRGAYLLPITQVLNVRKRVNEFSSKTLPELVEKFIPKLDDAKKEAEKRLGSEVFNPLDYLSAEEVRNKFSYTVRFVQMGVDPKLKEVSEAFYEAEQEKAASEWAEYKEEAQQALRLRTKEVVDYLMEKLTPAPDGKKKIIRKDMKKRLEAFEEVFADLNNISGEDKDLAALVDKMHALMSGVDPEALRDNDTFRSTVQKQMEGIKTELDSMIIDSPGRRIKIKKETPVEV